MKTPHISVITATRNVEQTLPALYDSLLKQSSENFEWVVADSQSNDGTVGLLRKFSHESSWVRYISEPDFGLYHAINKGLAIAQGQYYVVAGADDVFARDALLNYERAVSQSNADVILARVRRGGRVIGGFHPNKSWVGHSKVFAGSHSLGMLFRRALHLRFGYYSPRFPLLADGYFLKNLLASNSVEFMDADFISGRFAEGGVTTVSKLQILAETWQIQMMTEPLPALQMILFIGKLIVRYPAIARELLRAKKAKIAHTLTSERD